MKSVLFISLAAWCCVATSTAAPSIKINGALKDEALDNYIRQVINNFFAALETGIPELGLPPLDPIVVGNITVPTLIVPGGQVDASIADTDVAGLSDLTLTSLHLEVAMLKMDLRSFLPYLKISGLYDLEGVALGVFPLFGSGPYDVEVFDLVMLGGGDLDLDASGQYLQMTSLLMDTNFTTLAVNFENLLGGGDFGETINAILSQLGASIFDQVKPLVIRLLSDGIVRVVNDALSRFPLVPPTTASPSVGAAGVRPEILQRA